MSGTGYDHDWWYALDTFKGWITYSSGNTITKYNPTGTIPVGSCHQNTSSLSWNGIGVSSTPTVCPDKLNPVLVGDYGFGEKWTGYDSSDDIGIDPVDVDHSPSTASDSATLQVYIHWS